MYLISIVIPIIIIIMEHKGINLSEIIYMAIAKFYETTRKFKKMQGYLAETYK